MPETEEAIMRDWTGSRRQWQSILRQGSAGLLFGLLFLAGFFFERVEAKADGVLGQPIPNSVAVFFLALPVAGAFSAYLLCRWAKLR